MMRQIKKAGLNLKKAGSNQKGWIKLKRLDQIKKTDST
jgi:hypothetical protein